jgi:serine/threonine protein kinase
MDFQGRSKLLKEYQMGKTIGQGAFSKVKLGYHRETGQKVAIKVIDKKVMAEKAKKSKEAHEEREKKTKTKNTEIITDAFVSAKEDSGSVVNTQYPESDDEMIVAHPEAEGVDFVSKLQLEVQLMLRLEHPNIVPVYQVIDSEEECFIIMYLLVFNS